NTSHARSVSSIFA
ncbi:hypothetical protein ECNE037_3323, partial [Escherichia coli NE037]